MADLDREFALTTDGVSPLVLERLQRMGIPNRIIFGPRHYVGVARIVTTSDGLFEFHDDGEVALVVPEGEPEWPCWAQVHDLITFKPDNPGRWWRRRGDVDLLGASNMTQWRLAPLCIHETPLSWLQAGADGICIVDWAIDPIARLVSDGHLEVQTLALKQRLESRIREVALASFDVSVLEEVCHAA